MTSDKSVVVLICQHALQQFQRDGFVGHQQRNAVVDWVEERLVGPNQSGSNGPLDRSASPILNPAGSNRPIDPGDRLLVGNAQRAAMNGHTKITRISLLLIVAAAARPSAMSCESGGERASRVLQSFVNVSKTSGDS